MSFRADDRRVCCGPEAKIEPLLAKGGLVGRADTGILLANDEYVSRVSPAVGPAIRQLSPRFLA